METFSLVNREVTVNSFYFTQNQRQNFKSFPRRIEFDGNNVTFAESGLRLLIKSGQKLAELFDMSGADGQTYRLKLENNSWTLVGVKGGAL
jgi:hypothetical protein